MHRSVLVSAPDGPPLNDALALAIGLARPRGARVIVLRPAGAPPAEVLGDGAPADVPVVTTPMAGTDNPVALHAAVDAHEAELLVVDPAIAARMAHEAPCAIAVAPAGSVHGAPAEPRRIAVAWDGSAEADEALEWAVQLAERTAGSVRIVYVFDHAAAGSVAGPDVRARLEQVRAAAAQRATSTVEVRTGHPVAELAGAVGDADLLVMGSRAHGPLLRVVLGSVASGVVRAAPCAVVVLPRGVHAPVETTV